MNARIVNYKVAWWRNITLWLYIIILEFPELMYYYVIMSDGVIAGGMAGVVVETALYPIDTIKTRLQVPLCDPFLINLPLKS